MARRPSSWVNLEDYLGLNQEQGSEMGSRVVQAVGEKAGAASRGITSAQRQFGYGVEGGTLGGPDDNAWNSSSNMYTADEAAAKSQQGYHGPKSLADVNPDLYGQVQDAVSRVKSAQDPNQRGMAIAEAYGGQAGGGVGGRALDSFLAGQTSGAALSGLTDSYGGLMDSLGIAEKDATARSGAAVERSNANAKQWGELTPVLEEEAHQQQVASEAGKRAHEKQLFDIAMAFEQAHGHGSTGRAGLQDSAFALDPREEAYIYGYGEEYDRKQREQGAPEWQGKADYTGEGLYGRNAPEPHGQDAEDFYKAQRRRGSWFGLYEPGYNDG